jgi:hypothetical protein
MTNQIQGEILFDGWAGGAEDQWVYTPWMPVRGDFGTFGVEVEFSNTTLSWTVETRTIEDAAATVILSSTQTGAGTVTSTVRAKQLVRYKFHTASSASTDGRVVFRALQPSWQVDR